MRTPKASKHSGKPMKGVAATAFPTGSKIAFNGPQAMQAPDQAVIAAMQQGGPPNG